MVVNISMLALHAKPEFTFERCLGILVSTLLVVICARRYPKNSSGKRKLLTGPVSDRDGMVEL